MNSSSSRLSFLSVFLSISLLFLSCLVKSGLRKARYELREVQNLRRVLRCKVKHLVVYRDKHCYVTGGSSGLGLSVAQELTKAGAHVSIVARDEGKLATAIKSLEVCSMKYLSNVLLYLMTNCRAASRLSVKTQAKSWQATHSLWTKPPLLARLSTPRLHGTVVAYQTRSFCAPGLPGQASLLR